MRFPRLSSHLMLAALAAILLALGGCGKDRNGITEATANELYTKAKSAMDASAWDRSISLYRALQTRYPFGRYTEQSMLDLSYAYFRRGMPDKALSTLDRFIRTYPTHPNVDYAFYLKGLVNYEQNLGFLEKMMPLRARDRDQSKAQEAFMDFSELIRRYPDSRYVSDARQRMVFLRNNLAAYEVIVAEYYLRREAFVAAANRARFAIEVYPNTPSIPEALAIQHAAYSELELFELAQDSWDVLALNYPDHYYIQGKKKRRSWTRWIWPFD